MYPTPNIIRVTKGRRITYAGQVAGVGRRRNASTIMGRKPDGKNRLGRPRRRWDENTKIDREQTE